MQRGQLLPRNSDFEMRRDEIRAILTHHDALTLKRGSVKDSFSLLFVGYFFRVGKIYYTNENII